MTGGNFYPHTFTESHGCKTVDECDYSLAKARNKQNHTCKGVEVKVWGFTVLKYI